MCNIAGYTGKKRAVEVLIDMMRKEQFIDGGLSTGIATVHEGKIYTAKVLGDVDDLIKNTDVLNFPGTTGIMHSRPSGNRQSHAHPFTSNDGKVALVLNGTARDNDTPEFLRRSNEIMQGFFDRGFEIKTAYKKQSPGSGRCLLSDDGIGYHDSEPYALMIGDMVSGSTKATLKKDMADAMEKAITELPIDIVTLAVHAELDGVITVGDITRPMVAGFGNGETYLATTALAFPDDVQRNSILHLPPTSITQVTPEGVNVIKTSLDGVRVEQIDFRIASVIYERMEKLLKGQKDDPKSLYDIPCYTDWRDVWSEPYVDCKYAKDGGLLKPYADILYRSLWSFHVEGRLHSIIGERNGRRIIKFWID